MLMHTRSMSLAGQHYGLAIPTSMLTIHSHFARTWNLYDFYSITLTRD